MRGNSKGHRIKYREKDKNWIDVNIADHWINERLFTGLHEYIEYQFKVQARNTLHDGPLSAQTNILTDQDSKSFIQFCQIVSYLII